MTSTPPAKQPASLFGRWTGDVISGRWTPSSKGEATSGSARGKGGNAAERQFGVDITSPTINRTAATSAAEHGNNAKGLTPAFMPFRFLKKKCQSCGTFYLCCQRNDFDRTNSYIIALIRFNQPFMGERLLHAGAIKLRPCEAGAAKPFRAL